MKHTRALVVIVSLFLLASVILTACGSKADSGQVTLTVSGLVDKPLNLTDTSLHAMKVADITAEHPKKGSQAYSGVRLSDLLAKAKVQGGATTLVFTASDDFSAELDLTTVNSCADCMVAFTDTAGTYQLVMPGQASKLWVKNLIKIEAK
jgi:hypothetical protein